MRHRKKKIHLSGPRDYRTALRKNLATSLILYEKMTTTLSKAKATAPVIEKLITIAKKAEKKEQKMNVIRQLNRIVFDQNASRKLIEELNKRYQDRNSGFTRIVNLGFRKGDAAPLVQIELT